MALGPVAESTVGFRWHVFDSYYIVDKNRMEKLEKLLHSVGGCFKDIEEERRRLEVIAAPNFRLFNFIRNDEIGLSRCLAFLLNVNGDHGQGDLYLDLFFKKFIPKKYLQKGLDLLRAKVAIEKNTHCGRRIDICIEIPGCLNVGIENKPWAADQHQQLQDYSRFLERISGNGDWILMYLCNRDPSAASIDHGIKENLKEKGNFLQVSFSQLIDWLRLCLTDTKADKVRFFIDDMIKFIDQEINNMIEVREDEKIISLLKDSDNLASAFAVSQCLHHMKRRLMVQLRNDLRAGLGKIGYTAHFDEKLFDGGAYTGFSIYKSDHQRYKLRFEFDKERFNHLFFGIKAETDGGGQGSEKYKIINSKMCNQFGDGRWNAVWCWWADIDQSSNIIERDMKNWENNPIPWMSIKDGYLVDRICRITKEVEGALSGTDLLN